MNSGGVKRALVLSTISACALVGLASLPAHAQTIRQGEDVLVDLYSLDSGAIGIRNDGNNATVTLMAGSSSASVNSFSFYYLKGATEVLIADVANVNGVGTTQWTPPVGAELAAITGVRVKALDNGDVQVGGDVANPIFVPTQVGSNNVVGLTGTTNSPLGVYRNRVIISGKATDPGSTTVNVEGPSTSDAGTVVTTTGPADSIGTPVAGLATISAANNTADPLDSVIVRALTSGNGSDDEQVYELYDQAITTVTSAVAAGYSANVSGPATETRYVVKALDQSGRPIGGVDVYQANITGAPAAGIGRTPGNGGLGTVETDVLGQTVVRLNEADIDTASDADTATDVGATYVVVDYDEDGAYDLGLDQLFKLSVSKKPTTAASIDIASSKGFVLDDDERADLTVTVKDAAGMPVPGADVALSVAKDVADNTPVDSTTSLGTVTTGDDGQVVLPNVNMTEDGNRVVTTVTATVATISKVQTFETDQAKIRWSPAAGLQAAAGSSTTATGALALPSGAVLPGRAVNLQFTRTNDADGAMSPAMVPGNASFAPQADQPAGTVRGGDLIASATTDGAGAFSVRITDPAAPTGYELGDTVTAGMTVGGADSATPLTVDFIGSVTPATITVNSVTNLLGAPTPGRPVTVNYTVRNAEGFVLTSAPVTVAVTNGAFLTPPATTAANLTAVAAGGLFGRWASLGASTTAPQGGSTGNATIAIERAAGFDDDFTQNVGVTLTAGAVSTTVPGGIDFTTSAAPALNLGDVALTVSGETAPDADQPVQTREAVFYDASAKDQFGNPTRATVTTDDAGNAQAGFGPLPTAYVGAPAAITGTTLPAAQPNGAATFVATGTGATTQAITATVSGVANTASATDQDPSLPGAQVAPTQKTATKTLTDSLAWYVVDFAASTYTLSAPPSAAVGSPLTATATALDQRGNAIRNAGVRFARTGPDTTNGPAGSSGATDATGSETYMFAGTRAGRTTVYAQFYENAAVGSEVPTGAVVGTADPVTVRIGDPGTVRQPIRPKASARGAGPNVDVITVKAKSAVGARVELYRALDDDVTMIATAKLDSTGTARFRVKDTNRGAKTFYAATVAATRRTQAGTTNAVGAR